MVGSFVSPRSPVGHVGLRDSIIGGTTGSLPTAIHGVPAMRQGYGVVIKEHLSTHTHVPTTGFRGWGTAPIVYVPGVGWVPGTLAPKVNEIVANVTGNATLGNKTGTYTPGRNFTPLFAGGGAKVAHTTSGTSVPVDGVAAPAGGAETIGALGFGAYKLTKKR
jgi:hypothetical protein